MSIADDFMDFEIDGLYSAEEEAEKRGLLFIGMDEAGRGPLMGPVVAGAVIMPYDDLIPEINDSKKLTEKTREKLYSQIINKALAYGVGIVDNKTIDAIGIGDAVRRAFTEAADDLMKMAAERGLVPSLIYNDEVKWKYGKLPNRSIIKGDAKVYSIAAASIIAKVTRDRIINELATDYPEFQFDKHKGYGTKAHFDAIEKYGVTDLHRITFLTKNHGALLNKKYVKK